MLLQFPLAMVRTRVPFLLIFISREANPTVRHGDLERDRGHRLCETSV